MSDNYEYRIRKLTPKECWRLMGFSDEAFDKAQASGVSNSQLYKQAGNSIVTDVLYHIYQKIYEAMPYLFDELKITSLFSGIGAFEIAFNRLFEENLLGDWELVNFCEFDKYAEQSYCAVHGVDKSKNLGDITMVDEKSIRDFTMMCGGSPCQDFSVAGKQAGAMWTCKDCGHTYNPLEAHFDSRDFCPECLSDNIEKTRSSLLVEYLRILREKHPKWAMYENVKNIVGRQFKATFDLFVKEMNEYGYNCYYKVLNAKDYGIPQNRERIYIFIVDKTLDNGKFEFPEPFDNGLRLKDMLEDEVDEKFYITNDNASKLIQELKDNGTLDNIEKVRQC